MMATPANPTQQEPKLAQPYLEARATMELQRTSARFTAMAGQIVLRSIQDLARRQADAVGNTVADLTHSSGSFGDGQPLKTVLDLQHRYLRLTVLGMLAQLQLGLEAAAATSAETLALAKDQFAEMTQSGSAVTTEGPNGAET
jgi:hypothetical protein